MRRASTFVRLLIATILLSGLLAPFTTVDVWADEVDAADIPPTGLIQIRMNAGDTGAPLGGVCYLVTDANGIPFAVCDADGDGLASVGGLAIGEAYVEQTSTPSTDYAGGATGTIAIYDGAISELDLTSARIAPVTPAEEAGGDVSEGEGDEDTVEDAIDGEGDEEIVDDATDGEGDEEIVDDATEGEGGEEIVDDATDGEGDGEATDDATDGEGDEGATDDATDGEGLDALTSENDQPIFLADDDALFDVSCSFNPSTGLSTLIVTVLLDPNDDELKVTFTPYDRQLNPLPQQTSNTYVTTFSGVEWRQLDFVIERGDPQSEDYVTGIGTGGCDTGRLQPELTTTPYNHTTNQPIGNNGQLPLGNATRDTAVLSGQTINATGTVTYRLYEGDACTGDPVFTNVKTVVDGVVPDSDPFTPTTEGIYNWQATYEGDDLNEPAVSVCGNERLVVGQITPGIVTDMRNSANQVVPNNGSIQVGDSITDLAILSGGLNPTGTVTYQLFSGSDCTGAPVRTFENVPVGTRSPAATDLAIGTYRWVATYNGDATHASVVSGCDEEVFSVTQRTPTVVTTPQRQDGASWINISNNSTIPLDSVVRDTAVLNGATPNAGGTVTFYIWAGNGCDPANALETFANVPVVNGVIDPSGTILIDLPGTYTWQARYSGDTNNAPANSNCGSERFTVNKVQPDLTTTMMDMTTAPGVVMDQDALIAPGSTVSDRGTLTGATADAGGEVVFTLYREHLCNAGDAVFTFTAPVVNGELVYPAGSNYTIPVADTGSYNWVAIYSGDDRNASATSGCGEETFHVGVGSGTVATQVRDANDNDVADGANQEVFEENRDYAFLNGFTPDAGGTVTFFLYYDNDCVSGSHIYSSTSTVVNGQVQDPSGFHQYMNTGRYEWQAVYSGDENNRGSASPCGDETVNVTRRATSITTEMRLGDDSVLGQNAKTLVPFTTYDTTTVNNAMADVQPLTGTLTYTLFDNAQCVVNGNEIVTTPTITDGVLPASGNVSITEPGTYQWIVSYSGDAYRAPSTSACGDETFRAAVQPTITTEHMDDGVVIANGADVLVGSVVRDSATLSGMSPDATGTVTFVLYAGAPCVGTPYATLSNVNVSADGTIQMSDELTLEYTGDYYWVATYNGNDHNFSAVSDCSLETFTVTESTPSIATSMWSGPSAGQQDATVPQGGYVQVPFWASDATVIINAPLSMTGDVTYQLMRADVGSNPCAGTIVHTFDAAVDDIRNIPNASAFNVTVPGIYNWIVTFTPDGGGDPVVSGCGEETFIAFPPSNHEVFISCRYFPASKTFTYRVAVPKLSPASPDYHPPVAGSDPGLIIVATPTMLDNSAGTPITYHNYDTAIGPNNPNFIQQPWRNLSVQVTFPDGVIGTANAGCANPMLDPTIVTTMKDASGATIENGTNLELPAQIRDTAIMQNATIDFTGTFTYRLYNSAGCLGDPVFTSVKTVTTPGVVPDSDLFTLTDQGQYRWQVSYSGNSMNNPVVSNCQDEYFSVADGPTPVQPIVTDNVCVAGVFQPPVIVIADGNGFTYEVTQQPTVDNGWTYTVVATLSGTDPMGDVNGSGWTRDGDFQATYNGTVDPGLCIEVEPVMPTFGGNTCINDVYTEPTIAIAEDADGIIIYEILEEPTSSNGGLYRIKATIVVGEYTWGDLTGTGWVPNGQEAILEEVLPLDLCVEETFPVDPTVSDNTCIAGVFNPPVVNVPEDTAVFDYELTQVPGDGNNWTYVVTSTITDSDYIFGDLTGTGWTRVSDTVATFEETIELNECEPVVPVTPEIEDNACIAGVFNPPVVTFTNVAPIEYTINEQPSADNGWTYTVTATIVGDGAAWGDLTDTGFEVTSPTTATYDGAVDPKLCELVSPVDPFVFGDVCTNGAYTPPFVFAVDSEKIDYSVVQQPTADNGWTYIVTADLIGNGIAWDDLSGTDWEVTTPTRATLEVTMEPNLCEEVTPDLPTVNGNACVAGVYTPPTISVTDTDRFDYLIMKQPIAGNGWSYSVTARMLVDGIAWGDLTGTGWRALSNTLAIYDGTVTPNFCEPVLPVAPGIEGNACVAGVYTPPTVVPATTPEGVTYVVTQSPAADNNWTYIVTATISEDGIAWDNLTGTGWLPVNPTTATYTSTVTPDLCEEVEPIAPTVLSNACVDGVFQPPVLEVAVTPGITYTVTQSPTVDNNWTYVVTAEITADGIAWADLSATDWDVTSATEASLTRTIDPNLCIEVTPVNPDIDGNACVAGVFTPPTIDPVGTEGMTYTVEQQPTADNNWTYIVRADLASEQYAWDDLTTTDWERVSDTVARLTDTVDPALCEKITPIQPDVTANTCEAGVFNPPVVSIGTTTGISYAVTQQPTADNDWTYIVTAQIVTDGIAWDDLAGSGWERDSDTFATFTDAVEPAHCELLTPVNPDIEGNTCVAGVFTPPTIVVTDTDEIDYSVTEQPTADNNWTYTVSAELLVDGIAWDDLTGTGWARTSDTVATLVSFVEPSLCEEIVPIEPEVTANTCVAGVFNPPVVTIGETDGITYVVTQQPTADNDWTYVVTAEIEADGIAWGNLLGSDWTKIDDTNASFTAEVIPALCEEIVPIEPVVTDNTCELGVFNPPVVTIGETDGITYVVTQQPTADNDWTYVVTAEIVTDGIAWGDLTETGWTKIDDTNASFTGDVDPALCEEIVPIEPVVTDNTCEVGVFNPPVVTIGETDGITYVVTQQPTADNDWTYIVTAEIVTDGIAWGDLTDTGWTKIDDTNASFTAEVIPALCEEIVPIEPVVTDNTCEVGVFNPPVVTIGETDGITYVVTQQPTADNDWTYIVTAEIVTDGIAWGDLTGTGWTKIDDTNASFTGDVDPALCEEIVPLTPQVQDNECVAGVYNPTVEIVGQTEGIAYVVTQQPTSDNGWTYIVTAEIVTDGIAWGDLTDTGWTKDDDTNATFTGEVTPALCEEVIPAVPTVIDSTCINNVFTPPSIVPGETDGITYTVTKTPSEGNGWTFIVRAEITADGIAWGDLTGTGWTKIDDTTATFYGGPIDVVDCDSGGEGPAPTPTPGPTDPIDPKDPKDPGVPVTELPSTGTGTLIQDRMLELFATVLAFIAVGAALVLRQRRAA